MKFISNDDDIFCLCNFEIHGQRLETVSIINPNQITVVSRHGGSIGMVLVCRVYVCVCVHRERERDRLVISEEFKGETFSLKYSPMTSECKTHYDDVDLHYFK